MRLIRLLLLFIILLSFSAVADLDISETSLSLIAGENEADSMNFSIINTDATATLTNIQFSYNTNDFSDGDNVIGLTFDPVSIASLAPQASQQVKLTATIPDNMDIGIYSGIVNATSGALTDSFTLKVIVKPEICSDGIQGIDLIPDITDPASGDEFKPNDKLDIDIDIDNDGDDDLKVVVEALLYDMDKGKKIASIESDAIEVEENDDNTFNLKLDIPTDSKYLKEGNNYMLFVKSYEKGDEDKNCNEDFIDLELELEEDDVIIESMKFSPTTASCGDSLTATLVTRNIGSDDQDDVRVELMQDQLKVSKISEFFDLDDFNDKNNNDKTTIFTFTIPENADEKEYTFDATVQFGSSDSYTFDTLDASSKLTVSGCVEDQETSTTATSAASQLAISSIVKSAAIGSTLSIPYTITNTGSASQTYTVEFVPSGTWSTKQSQTVTIGSGQTSQNTVTILINSGISEGIYSGTMKLLSGNTLLDSKTISLELLNPNSITTRAIYRKTLLDDLRIGNLSVGFWIIGNLILAIIIAVLAYLLLKK